MYGKAEIKTLNGTRSSAQQEPQQLSASLVSNGVVIASRNQQDLPQVGVVPPEGFSPEGDPVKIQLNGDVESDFAGLTLEQTRKYLAKRYEADPSLYWGTANRGGDWAQLQAYRKI
jgi:hypothetical protein